MSLRLLTIVSPGVEATVLRVLEELLELDVELVFGAGRRGHRIPESLLARPGVSVASIPLERAGPERDAMRTFRHAANTLKYLDPTMASRSAGLADAARGLFKKLQHPDPGLMQGVELPQEVFRRLTKAVADVERLIPPHPELERAVVELRPDAVFLVSRIGLNSVELDVLKVARNLGLPSAMLVHSWDNLSSKAVLHEHPDHLLVWNDVMAGEATAYHRIAPERVVVVGAPLFDDFFDLAQATAPPPPGETTVLYLGSSPYVADPEAELFDQWLAAVRAAPDPVLAGARVDVRPHPADHSFDDWQSPDGRVAVHPSRKLEREKLLALVRSASAVVALNTSAEIEAAIAGRPVLTFRAGDRAPGQDGTVHFEYLLEARGGFVIDAASLDEHVGRLSRVVHGHFDAARTQQFVERFLRPHGLARPVSPLVAGTVRRLCGEAPVDAQLVAGDVGRGV